MTATITVYVPRDSAATSVGADATAAAIVREAAARHVPVQVVRNGSRGMLWLEPLVEVVTPQGLSLYTSPSPRGKKETRMPAFA